MAFPQGPIERQQPRRAVTGRRPFKEPRANLGSKRWSLPGGGADPDDVEAPAILT